MTTQTVLRSRGKLKSALHNTLDAFVSRYSDYDGYWLLGHLHRHLDGLCIDLLQSDGAPPPNDVIGCAEARARSLFRRQLGFVDWTAEDLTEATLDVVGLGDLRWRNVQTDPMGEPIARRGRVVTFRARAVARRGFVREVRQDVYVAPHTPWLESRSARALHL